MNSQENLSQGIREKQFIPYIQPVVDADTERLIGGEVLIRWKKNDKEILTPESFLREAECTGLITRMTYDLLEDITDKILPLFTNKKICHEFHIAININPVLLNNKEFIIKCINFMNVFPERKMTLILEITEREKVLYSKNEEENLKRLRAHGIKISLDDFGTGYSSYVYLQQFPVDFIKIDKIFIHKIGIDKTTEIIINNILLLGKELKLKVIAEGVETFEQANYLKEAGIHYLQGYAFGRPVSIDEFIENF